MSKKIPLFFFFLVQQYYARVKHLSIALQLHMFYMYNYFNDFYGGLNLESPIITVRKRSFSFKKSQSDQMR